MKDPGYAALCGPLARMLALGALGAFAGVALEVSTALLASEGPEWATVVAGLPRYGGRGAAAGLVFGGLLNAFESRRRLRDLSLQQVVWWSFLGGILGPAGLHLLGAAAASPNAAGGGGDLSAVLRETLVFGLLFAAFGAVVAVTTRVAGSDDESLEAIKDDFL